jgi:hypothetical protein
MIPDRRGVSEPVSLGRDRDVFEGADGFLENADEYAILYAMKNVVAAGDDFPRL